MTSRANFRYQWLAAWSGIAFEVLYPFFWAFLGHAQPPPSPSLTSQQLADFYMDHHQQILLGMSVSAVVGILWVPWTAQLTIMMLRIERDAPILTLIQLMGGALTAWVLVFTPAIWATAALRPGVSPDVVESLNDIAFMTFNLTYAVTSVQAISFGLLGLTETSEQPTFPRWVCYFAIFTGISFFPVTLVPFFKTGPFAIDGAILGWVPGACFFLWTGILSIYMVIDTGRKLRLAKPV